MKILNNIITKLTNFYTNHKKQIFSTVKVGSLCIGMAVAPSIVQSQPITPEKATQIDSLVAQDYNLGDIIEFGQTHIFYTASGTRYDIPMAVVTSNDTVSGGDLSGYVLEENTTPAQRAILNNDSLPNTCISVLTLDMDSTTYDNAARYHWEGCGYFFTDTPEFSIDATSNGLLAYPVPFQNGFTIKPKEEISIIQIHNLSGQNIYENLDKVDANTTLFLNPKLKDGMYFLSAKTKKGNTLETKVIKQ